jgi:hypothetical protein
MIPGAMTIAFPRIAFGLFSIFIMSILSRIILIGADIEKPLNKCRKCAIRTIYRIGTLGLCVICTGCWPSHTILTKEDVDYGPYLGPNWKKDLEKHIESG